jgi:IS1 family transposase
MNKLNRSERAQIIRCLVEGASIRATVRMTGFAKNTIVKLLVELGAACAAYQDEHLRFLDCQHIQADEIWSFVYAKAKNVPEDKRETFGYGDAWTWTALDADSKLMVTWLVGERSLDAARDFMADLASRLVMRPQITTDANVSYREAIEAAFGSDVDYAQLLKQYGTMPSEDGSPTARRYSPNTVMSVEKRVISGNPDPDHISTSHVERSNLSMRMGMRRFTRLTNGFSKKVENLAAAVSLYFLHYNFGRVHQSLGKLTTPAMAAGIADHVWSCEEIAALLD